LHQGRLQEIAHCKNEPKEPIETKAMIPGRMNDPVMTVGLVVLRIITQRNDIAIPLILQAAKIWIGADTIDCEEDVSLNDA
jgi:hypothetical protein